MSTVLGIAMLAVGLLLAFTVGVLGKILTDRDDYIKTLEARINFFQNASNARSNKIDSNDG